MAEGRVTGGTPNVRENAAGQQELMVYQGGGSGAGAAPVPTATTMQNAAGANGNGTSLNVQGYAVALLQITITGTAQVNLEYTLDDSNWQSISATLSNALVQALTASGVAKLYVAGMKSIRARISGWASGTVTVVGYVANSAPFAHQFGLLAGEQFIGKVGASAGLSPVTFSLDTSAYGSGDLLADTQVVTGAFRVSDGTGILDSIVLNDKDDQGVAMYVVILNANVSLGSENSAPSITDANGDSILGIIPILASDWIDMGGCRIATKTGIGLEVQAATGTTSLYIGLLNGTGTPTFTASGITAKLGILKD